MNLPRMSLHIGDYKRDTGHLRAAEHGAYMLLIMHYWSTGGLPTDDKHLAAIACMSDREWKAARSTIAAFFKEGWTHGRIDAEIEAATKLYEKKCRSGKEGAEARWGSKRKQGTRAQRLSDARNKGMHSQSEWEALRSVFGGHCVKCGISESDLNGGACCKDHVVPIAMGGGDAIGNLQPMCRQCNLSKGNEVIDYRAQRVHDWEKRLAEALGAPLANACQPITLTTKEEEKRDMDSARATVVAVAIRAEAHKLSDECYRILGISMEAMPPEWCGLAHKIDIMLACGYDPPIIVATFAKLAGQKPLKPMNYFVKAVESAQQNQMKPAEKSNGSTHVQSNKSAIAALDRLGDAFAAYGLREETGQAPVVQLPARRLR